MLRMSTCLFKKLDDDDDDDINQILNVFLSGVYAFYGPVDLHSLNVTDLVVAEIMLPLSVLPCSTF